MFNNGFIQQNTNNSSNENLSQKIRKDIMGELEAIIQYEQHIMNTNNPKMQKVWKDISSEEKVHIGELMAAMFYFDKGSKELVEKGIEEFDELIRQ